jgi:hypothetical protein
MLYPYRSVTASCVSLRLQRYRCLKCSATGYKADTSALAFWAPAQIDRYANLNTTLIGDYREPKVRLPGGH